MIQVLGDGVSIHSWKIQIVKLVEITEVRWNEGTLWSGAQY